MNRGLVIIGQAPSRLGDPNQPLMGVRLRAKLIDLMGIDERVYLDRVTRTNLIYRWHGKAGKGDKFDQKIALNSAAAMRPLLVGARVLLLGGGVAKAFGLGRLPPLTWTSRLGFDAALLPHPSGVSLWWNLPSNRIAAREFMREVGRTL